MGSIDEQVGSILEAGGGWVRGSVLGPREGAELMALAVPPDTRHLLPSPVASWAWPWSREASDTSLELQTKGVLALD